jgi:hypothetical protein
VLLRLVRNAPIWKEGKSREAMTDRQSAKDAWVEVDERMTVLPIGERWDRVRQRFGRPLRVSHIS